MLRGKSSRIVHSLKHFLCFIATVVLFLPQWCIAVVVPDSNCYVIDNSSRLVDFTDWIGHPFEYNGKDADLVVRFCKDIESRSQAGYIDFGHYSSLNYFSAGSGPVNYIQGFYEGDLAKCEQSFDKMGRTAQVNIVCGSCLHGACKGDLGCVCDATYDAAMCRAFVELAIPCKKNGPRVFEGFTVGFHPRTWEVVYNGLTQKGFEKTHQEFSFGTEQTDVSLYLTAISSLSALVGKPSIKVNPDKGLDVKLSGSATDGKAPTTLSPSILIVNWRCENARDSPYEVSLSVPIQGYDPVDFTFSKVCEYTQRRDGDALRGWATFGILSCIFIVLSTLFCCGGFAYRVHMEQQHGLDALPGITILSACLEAVTGSRGYRQPDDMSGDFVNRASWEHVPVSSEGSQRASERTYGSI